MVVRLSGAEEPARQQKQAHGNRLMLDTRSQNAFLLDPTSRVSQIGSVPANPIPDGEKKATGPLRSADRLVLYGGDVHCPRTAPTFLIGRL